MGPPSTISRAACVRSPKKPLQFPIRRTSGWSGSCRTRAPPPRAGRARRPAARKRSARRPRSRRRWPARCAPSSSPPSTTSPSPSATVSPAATRTLVTAPGRGARHSPATPSASSASSSLRRAKLDCPSGPLTSAPWADEPHAIAAPDAVGRRSRSTASPARLHDSHGVPLVLDQDRRRPARRRGAHLEGPGGIREDLGVEGPARHCASRRRRPGRGWRPPVPPSGTRQQRRRGAAEPRPAAPRHADPAGPRGSARPPRPPGTWRRRAPRRATSGSSPGRRAPMPAARTTDGRSPRRGPAPWAISFATRES